MSEYHLTPQTSVEELLSYLHTLNLKEQEDRKKLRSLVSQATPKQFFTVILPFVYQARPDIQEKLKGTHGTILIQIEGEGGGEFILRLKDGLETGVDPVENPDFSVRMDIETWRGMNRREIQPQAAFFQGKIRFSGNLALAFKLVTLLRG